MRHAPSFSRRNLLHAAWAAATASLIPLRAGASIAPAVTLSELVSSSRSCVRAVPLTARSRWVSFGRGRRIVTSTRVRVEATLGGNSDSEVLVQTLGGQVGQVGQVVHGEALLLLGEPCLLFLTELSATEFTVAHFAQGHFPLRQSAGALRVTPSPRVAELSGRGAVEELRGLVADNAALRIRRAWNDAHT